MDKSTVCLSRGPEFNSQQLHGGSQPCTVQSNALFWPSVIHRERAFIYSRRELTEPRSWAVCSLSSENHCSRSTALSNVISVYPESQGLCAHHSLVWREAWNRASKRAPDKNACLPVCSSRLMLMPPSRPAATVSSSESSD